MARTLYENNDVTFYAESDNKYETFINVKSNEDENLIVIFAENEESFKQELTALLDKYRI